MEFKSSENAEVPVGSNLAFPTGEVFLYIQSAAEISKGSYVDVNVNQRLCKFVAVGNNFPKGIITATTPRDWYVWVQVKEGKQEPVIHTPKVVT